MIGERRSVLRHTLAHTLSGTKVQTDTVVFERLGAWARAIRRDVLALWIAARDRRTPWYAKALAGVVAAYAFSPIDLIPDFIPVLGYIDDVVLVPFGIALALRLIPPALMHEFREAAAQCGSRPVSRVAATVVVASWIVGAVGLTVWWAGRR